MQKSFPISREIFVLVRMRVRHEIRPLQGVTIIDRPSTRRRRTIVRVFCKHDL